ncbi:MAG: aspartate dehydrogenase [Lachnospiraceae bacterium]|nr:aspartate dehydrogenase [Lachnospiraceae bacterium]
MFGRKREKEKAVRTWDREKTIPAVRCSICTGEQVFGFKDIHTGSFAEIAMIHSTAELKEIASAYGIEDADTIRKFY